MSLCEEWPASPFSFGPLRKRSSPSAASASTTGLKLLDAAPDFHQPGDMLLDERQRLDHLADALAGEILEIAGLENLHDAVLDVVGEPLLVAALEHRRERVRGLVDVLGGLQHLLGRLLGAADDRFEFAAGARDVRRARARAPRASRLRRGCARARRGSGRARPCRPAPRRSARASVPACRGSAGACGSIRLRSARISAMNS